VSEIARVRDRFGLATLAYGHRALFALLAAVGPGAIASRVSANWGGDAVLFEPGGVILFETQRLNQRALPAVLTSSFALLLVGTLVGALVLGALIDGFSRRSRLDAGDIADGATRALGTLALLLTAGLAAEALVAAVVIGSLAKAIGALHLTFGMENAANAAMIVLALLLVGTVSVIRDLACASAVLDRKKFGGAISAAWRNLSPVLAWSCGWRSVLSLAIAAVGWVVGSEALPPLAHQLAIFAIVLVHVSWIRVTVETTLAHGGEPPVRPILPSIEAFPRQDP
jgi:hypothetical protein